MQESPGLKPDWFNVISLLTRKNLIILLKINLSIKVCLSPFYEQSDGNEPEITLD